MFVNLHLKMENTSLNVAMLDPKTSCILVNCSFSSRSPLSKDSNYSPISNEDREINPNHVINKIRDLRMSAEELEMSGGAGEALRSISLNDMSANSDLAGEGLAVKRGQKMTKFQEMKAKGDAVGAAPTLTVKKGMPRPLKLKAIITLHYFKTNGTNASISWAIILFTI